MSKLTQEDIQKIHAFRSLFPPELEVKVHHSEDGGFFAEVVTFPGIITEADTFSELIEMVNDAVMAYFEMPEQYTAFAPSYIPPFQIAQEFGVFPVVEKEKRLKLQLAVSL